MRVACAIIVGMPFLRLNCANYGRNEKHLKFKGKGACRLCSKKGPAHLNEPLPCITLVFDVIRNIYVAMVLLTWLTPCKQKTH